MAISTHEKVEGPERVHHQAVGGGGTGKRRSRKPQPPMTPMIDVTFQLLLFFIMTFEFRQSEGMIPGTLPGNLPPYGHIVGRPDPIRIRLIPSADCLSASYEMSGVPAAVRSPGKLGELLQSRQEMIGSREVPIVIFPSDDVPWKYVVEAFNQAKKARFDKIGFGKVL